MNYGFVKVASAIPSLKVADCSYNIQQIESLIVQAEGKGVEIIVISSVSNCCSKSARRVFSSFSISPGRCRSSPSSECPSWWAVF